MNMELILKVHHFYKALSVYQCDSRSITGKYQTVLSVVTPQLSEVPREYPRGGGLVIPLIEDCIS